MRIDFYKTGEIANEQFHFAVICAAHKGKWIFVRNRERATWEIPGGHREDCEEISLTAARELFEETGALEYTLEPVCDYSVTVGGGTTYGRLYYSDVKLLGALPESEIGEVSFLKRLPSKLTYPEIQPHLQRRTITYLAEKALTILKTDMAKNINIMNFMKNYPPDTVDIAGSSVMVRGRSDEDWTYFGSCEENGFLRLCELLDDGDKCFAAVEDWMLPHIIRSKKVRSRLSSLKLVFDERIPALPVKMPIARLTESDAPYIYENSRYKEFIDIGYITERIRKGIGLGIMEKNRLVAWALTHDDGAIGFLNVLEEHRGKGYGIGVTAAMVGKLLEQGDLPFVHIEENNGASLTLAKKAGFKEAGRIHWIKLKD